MNAPPPGPTVSVVIPSYNGASLIGETLESLARQTMGDFEALVVDDCSSDDSRALIAAWPDKRVRLIEMTANGGPVRARNRGFAEARGRYLAGLDQDDICEPDRFARQVAYLDAHPETALLGTAAVGLYEGTLVPLGYAPHTTPDLIAWLAWIENPIVWSTVMIRGNVAQQLDPLTRPEILYAEDFDLYHRIGSLGQVARLDEPLLKYRQHPGGASRRFTDQMRTSAMRVLAERHADVLGDDAVEAARLLVIHNMGREPVPDGATLRRLGDAIARLQAAFVAQHRPDAASLRLIRWETARRWGAIGRASLRSGAVRLTDVISARPPHLGLGYAGVDALLWSGLVGEVRRWRRAA